MNWSVIKNPKSILPFFKSLYNLPSFCLPALLSSSSRRSAQCKQLKNIAVSVVEKCFDKHLESLKCCKKCVLGSSRYVCVSVCAFADENDDDYFSAINKLAAYNYTPLYANLVSIFFHIFLSICQTFLPLTTQKTVFSFCCRLISAQVQPTRYKLLDRCQCKLILKQKWPFFLLRLLFQLPSCFCFCIEMTRKCTMTAKRWTTTVGHMQHREKHAISCDV